MARTFGYQCANGSSRQVCSKNSRVWPVLCMFVIITVWLCIGLVEIYEMIFDDSPL